MSELSYIIRHIPGGQNHWADLLSRLRSVGGAVDSGEEIPVCVLSIAVVAPTYADYSFPNMGKIRNRQDIYIDGKAVWTRRLEGWCAVKTGCIASIMGGCR